MNSKKLRLRAVTIALMAAIIALRCVNSGQLAGTITQSGNGFICGKVVDTSGGPGGVRVVLLPESYDPVKDTGHTAADTADASGNFVFKNISPGNYVIVAVHAGSGKRTVIRDVHVYEDRTDSLAADTLRAPGSIKVMALSSVSVTNGYLYIAGTPTFTFLKNNTGFVVLDSVAAGKPVTISYSTTATSAQSVLRYGVQVAPGDTAEVWNTGWNHARKITLNTSATGAGVTGNVTSFPVLVRLTEGNFAFTQARNNGEDIRFTKRDNTFLPYEIERWDAIGNKAEVWVRVDTVHGSDSAHSIIMYWGNADAAPQSNSLAVFDTSVEFAAVWHLSQPAGAIVPDATVNGNHGAVTATTTVPGAIGTAQMFNGVSSLIRASGSANTSLNFSENSAYSVSAWVKADTLDSLYHGIFYKSNRQYGLQIRPENNWEFLSFIQGTGWEGSRCQVSAKSWHFLTGVRRAAQQYLYVDGSCVDSSKVVQSSNLSRVLDEPFEIGHCPDGGLEPDRYFSGIIDEVRISSMASSADWIKLCYMNQKQQDALVKW